MNLFLPLALLYAGLRILIDPVIWSLKYGFIFDLGAVRYPLSDLLLAVGVVLLLEALGKGPFSKVPPGTPLPYKP